MCAVFSESNISASQALYSGIASIFQTAKKVLVRCIRPRVSASNQGLKRTPMETAAEGGSLTGRILRLLGLQSLVAIENEEQTAKNGNGNADRKGAIKAILGRSKIAGDHRREESAEVADKIVDTTDATGLAVRREVAGNGPDVGSSKPENACKGAKPENSPEGSIGPHAHTDEEGRAEHADSHSGTAQQGNRSALSIPFVKKLSACEFQADRNDVRNGCGNAHFLQGQAPGLHEVRGHPIEENGPDIEVKGIGNSSLQDDGVCGQPGHGNGLNVDGACVRDNFILADVVQLGFGDPWVISRLMISQEPPDGPSHGHGACNHERHFPAPCRDDERHYGWGESTPGPRRAVEYG